MLTRNFAYPSADGKTLIHGMLWLPEAPPVAALQIAHGVTEYIGRYERIAEFFTRHGVAVIGNDHLGHGQSVAPNGEPMYFGPKGSWSYAVEDIRSCRLLAEGRLGAIPYCMLGFSLGSFLVRDYLIRYPGTVDAAVLIGTGDASPMELAAAKYLASREADKYGDNQPSPQIHALTFDHYNQAFAPCESDFDWLCKNEGAVRAYEADPQRGGDFTCGLFREMLDGMIFTGKVRNIRRMSKAMPLYLLSGGDDPVGKNGKGVEHLRKKFEAVGCADVSMQIYPGCRHDILRETNGDKILETILRWMKRKLPRSEKGVSA